MIHSGGIEAKQGELGKLIFKAKDRGLANFVIDGEFYTDKAQLIQTNFENLQLQIGKEETSIEMQAKQEYDDLGFANTNLEILAIENYLIYPPFENSITEYTTQISNETEELNIFAVPENEQGKVEIYGNENLKEGNNIIIVTSTAPNGTSKRDYKINVYKRNINEEEQYKKEQNEKKEKLEEAYKIEKISTDNLEEINKKENRYIIIAIICGIVVASLFLLYGYSIKNKSSNI